MKKICLVITAAFVLAACAFTLNTDSIWAKAGSAKKYDLKLNKLYSADITGDKKAEKFKITADKDSEGYISYIKVIVNGKTSLSKVYAKGKEAKKKTSRAYPQVKYIRLSSGQPLLYIHLSTYNGYYWGGWVYRYKSKKMNMIFKTEKVLSRYYSSYPDAGRCGESLRSVKDNSLIFRVSSYSTPEKKYKYSYKGGKLVAAN